jgi:hypothetical protein
MRLNKQTLQEQLNNLHQQREKALAQLHAVDGAIQAIEQLINLSTQKEVKEVKEES